MLTSEKQPPVAQIPMRFIGPVKIIGKSFNAELKVPLATFETPLWPSTDRGAKVTRLAGGIKTTLISECMTRSVLLEGPDVQTVQEIVQSLRERHFSDLVTVVAKSSRFATLDNWHEQIVGRMLFLRFAFKTGDASGHNMATKAADALIQWILNRYPVLRYISISGNYCTDKKVSAVNGILGRGKYVVAELIIPRTLCVKQLRTTPQKMVELNIKKNLIGSLISGGIRSANAHFANMLLGFYLATGQDAANIIEGSQGIVHAEVTEVGDLYFSVTLPNVIVGTIGNGKHLPFVKANLAALGCANLQAEPGENSRRLSLIAAATVLCGELSLLAAQTNQGELTESHLRLERVQTADIEVVQ